MVSAGRRALIIVLGPALYAASVMRMRSLSRIPFSGSKYLFLIQTRYLMPASMLFSAFRVVTTINIVHAALWLVVVLAGVAAQFILLGAEFVAVTQVLVYIGAVVVLFLFGVMLTRGSLGDDETAREEKRSVAAIVGVLLFSVMAMALLDTWGDDRLVIDQPQTAQEVSDAIFSQYIVPFEAVSVLLLAALIGAIVVARPD